jgi:4-hydroxybutyrate CoA-transferase
MLGITHQGRNALRYSFSHIPMYPTALEAMAAVMKEGQHVYVQGMAATPTYLTNAMTEYGIQEKLRNINVYHMHTEGPCPYVQPGALQYFRSKSFFVGENVRKAIADGRAEYLPTMFVDLPALIRNKKIPVNTVLLQTSPPDENGFCSLGTSVEGTAAAMEVADNVICQINRFVPRTRGDSLVHISAMTGVVYKDAPLYTKHVKAASKKDEDIGHLIATNLVDDDATLQLGIGNIPNSVLAQLGSHKNLGIHSEMFSDGVIPLVKSGVVNGASKTLDTGKLVATFLVGSQELFDFVDNNPNVEMRDVAYTNDPHIVRQQKKMTSINSAIEVDMTGQVCADSIGTRVYSGFGGQVDFVRGAELSEGGKAIIALHSRTPNGKAKIVPCLQSGAGVITTRAHVDYIVTEYGISSLRGKTIGERARQLRDIAHPDDREAIDKAIWEQKL